VTPSGGNGLPSYAIGSALSSVIGPQFPVGLPKPARMPRPRAGAGRLLFVAKQTAGTVSVIDQESTATW